MSYIKFDPILQERVWGGRGLFEQLGRDLPGSGVYGESWDIVDREEAQSIVADGPHAGSSIRELIEEHTMEIMGPSWSPEKRFPVLVKWLDCQERLSLQVHPPQEVAYQLGGEPKSEAWYIADCSEGASLIAGLKTGVSKEAFEAALSNQSLESLCHRFNVAPGDHIYIPSGRIHAIDAGNLILEIQQNSDTTYRVYDWGRVGMDGNPRQLHIEKSLQSIDFQDFEPKCCRGSAEGAIVADCEAFRIEKRVLRPGERFHVDANSPTCLMGMVQGKLDAYGSNVLERGDNVLLPYVSAIKFEALEQSTFLLTTNFAI